MPTRLHGKARRAGGGGDPQEVKTIEFAVASDVGMVRGDNQDLFGKFPERDDDLAYKGGQLFLIADGMGGHRAGGEASELAVNVLAHYFYSVPSGAVAERIRWAFRGA